MPVKEVDATSGQQSWKPRTNKATYTESSSHAQHHLVQLILAYVIIYHVSICPIIIISFTI
jgi:hypothetical protein